MDNKKRPLGITSRGRFFAFGLSVEKHGWNLCSIYKNVISNNKKRGNACKNVDFMV